MTRKNYIALTIAIIIIATLAMLGKLVFSYDGIGTPRPEISYNRDVRPILSDKCFACHGPDAKGNPVIGSANLTDNIWLFGGTEEDIRTTIRGGRISQMPAHKKLLGEEKVHLLALYVYSLSHTE